MSNTLTKTEFEIMNYIWEVDKEVTASDIRKHFLNKNWSKQTISTFLKKLVDIGFLKVHKVSVVKYYYSALISKKEYELLPAKIILDNFYSGSYGNFICALLPPDIDKDDIAEIKRILEVYEKRIEDNATK
ncbi:MAG: BlaI/MecI/CopY family transcriptional regulator [Lachnospiraceae bacterium]|nr:BlaI/MecI/CopY family transcriptional regulator [Lachnospiraceae bacterium]